MAENNRQRRGFPDAFKLEAVAAVQGGRSVSQVAAELGLPDRLGGGWGGWGAGAGWWGVGCAGLGGAGRRGAAGRRRRPPCSRRRRRAASARARLTKPPRSLGY